MTRRAILAAALAVALLAPASGAGAAVRSEYFGIVQGQFDAEGLLDDQDLQAMEAAKVRTDRFELGWKSMEPSKGNFKWAAADHFIGSLASHRIRALPFIWKSPSWVAHSAASPPIDTAAHQQAWQGFLKALVGRYGPGGSYWSNGYVQEFGPNAVPLPVTSWQIWNEPNLRKFFDPGGDNATLARHYATLLRISHDAIKSQDPNADVVLAGCPGYPPSGGPKAWEFLDQLYTKVPAVKNYFDVAALHPYAGDPSGNDSSVLYHVQLELGKFRTVMKNHGDGSTPLWVTEIGWGSDPVDQFGINQGPQGQRQLLLDSYRMFLNHRAAWNLQRVYWFLWRDPAPNSQFAHRCSFCGSGGLLHFNRSRKLSYSAFTSFSTDSKPPTAQIRSGPTANTTISDATPTFAFGSNQAGSAFECHLDGSPFRPCAAQYTTAKLADGAHHLYLRAIDAAGNVSATVGRPFTVDSTPPKVTLTSGPANGSATNSQTATFTFTVDDPNATVTCQFDGGGFNPCGSSFSRSGLSDGTHAFQVRAADPVGNVATAASLWTVDTIAPTVTITSGPTDPSNQPRPSFEFAASESGVRFQCHFDSDPGPPVDCSSPYSASSRLPNGSRAFQVVPTDRAGNTGLAATWTWTLAAPAVDLRIDRGPAPGSVIKDPTPSFAFSSSDPQASFKCRVGGNSAPFTSCGKGGSGSFTSQHLRDGRHRFSVEAFDGGEVSPIVSRWFTVDTQGPKVTFSAGPANGAVSSDASPLFRFGASEPGSTFQCRVDSRKFAGCASPRSLGPLKDGTHVFRVRAVDGVGNIGAPAARSFRVDTKAPRLRIRGPRKVRTAKRKTSALFVLKASERVHRRCRIDSKPFAPCPTRYRTPKLGQGAHTLVVKATDRAGNVASRQKRFKVVQKAKRKGGAHHHRPSRGG
jgi:hypothetical protein